MQSPKDWLQLRPSKGSHVCECVCLCECLYVWLCVPVCVSFFLMKCPRRGAAGGNSLSLPRSTAKLHFITRSIDFTEPLNRTEWGQIALAFIKWRVYVYIYKQMNIHSYELVCVCVSCVAHVAEPQGVGELLASNWNCRFNILNYRLANGQYFVTTLPAPPPLPYCLLPPLPLVCLELPQTVTCTHQIGPHKLYCNKQSITLCVFPALDSHQFLLLPSPTWEGQLLEGVRLFGIRLFTETFHRFAVVVVAVAYSSWDCYI